MTKNFAIITRSIIVLSVGFTLALGAGCGVRGKPQPPLTPPELGRGEPTFKRATEEYAFPDVPPPGRSPDPRNSSSESPE